jgi:DNA (cytosine-5)-methyltransferase 1
MTKRRPVVVDLFCGAGGESQGIHWAAEEFGVDVDMYAVNHWERAIETHSLNFPRDNAICKDILDLDPLRVVPRRDVDLLWASPACTHFSVARGGKPMDEQSRVTPFTVLDWLEKLDVKRVIIENVPEFRSWGPLDDDKRPVKERKGDTFDAYIAMMRSLGYQVEWAVLNAADFGAPTTRRRIFIQAVKTGCGKRIEWPTPTHAKVTEGGLFSGTMLPWVPAKDVIDWTIPTEPIHMRKKPLSQNTMKRIETGIRKYWGRAAEPFLVRYNGGENRCHSIHEPVPTLDTSNRYGLVEPLIMEYYGNGQCRPVSVPLGTLTTKERFALVEGGAVGLGLRMIQPHEMQLAQSLPKTYRFAGNKPETVKQIGNMVCPKMALALVKAGSGIFGTVAA